SSWAAYLGIAVLALLLLALAEVDPFDGPLLVAAVIGFDVLLLSQLLANLYPYFDDAFGALLVSGLAVAAVFGVSLRVMRAVAERRGARLVATGSVKAALPEWPMTVLSVFGAQLAALPFLALLFLLFAPVLDSAGAYPMAVALMGAGVAGMKAFGERSFLNQQALTVLAVGIALLAVAAFRDVSLGQASLLVLLVVSLLATVVRPPWVAAMLGAMAAGLAVLCVGSQLASEPKDWLVGGYREQAFLIVTAVTAVALLLAAAARRQVPDRPLDIARLDHFTTGAAALLLLAVLAGNPTFLLSADPAGGLLSASVPLEWALTPSRAIAIVMVAAAGLWLKFRTAILDRTAAMGIGAATMALTYVMPILAVAVVLYAAARASSRRTLAVFAAVAGLWLMGSFYYWLGWPLMDKAQFLMLLGLGLGGLAYALDARLPAALTTGGQRDTLGVGARGLANRLGVPLILLSIVATALIVGRAVQDNESILANGRRILVALAPVDPRSLMQGDYMILRMRLPETPVALPVEALRFALADVAADDVATVIALSPERPVAGPTQVVIAIHAERGQTVMGTTSYFFREGTAKRFAEARFAEFRLAPDGRPLLTALADADKRIIATD
ncbi:MAG: GDYXXLXY domain-containing protein, partial [Hyphomicrobiaceae bacterium]|nr:GDYXXLXY domain-containing protein [Hyphomicrobiaceae bacterium]